MSEIGLPFHAARDLGMDGDLLKRVERPDEVHPVHIDGVEDYKPMAYRVRDLVPDSDGNGNGDTQGGFRLNVIGDNQRPEYLKDLQIAEALAGDMTAKLGLVLAALEHAGNMGWLPFCVDIPKTGGGKGIVTMRRSEYLDLPTRYDYLGQFTSQYAPIIARGDGIGPDKGADPDTMEFMAQSTVGEYGDSLLRHFTNRPDGFPGRPDATGRLAAAVLGHMIDEIPENEREMVVQGAGSAAEPFMRISAERFGEEKNLRLRAVGNERAAFVANHTSGLQLGRDFVIEGGTPVLLDSGAATSIAPDQLLYVPAGIKVPAATENVIHEGNWERALAGTRALIEIANLAISTGAAIAAEKSRTRIAAVPMASMGGVLISLFERHREALTAAAGRPITDQDTIEIIDAVTRAAYDLVTAESEESGVGLVTASYRVGVRHQYDGISAAA